jgi:serine protease Do
VGRGVLVAGVDDKGPAKPAGIEPGDVVVKVDGKDVQKMRDLSYLIDSMPPGRQISVTVNRKAKEQTRIVSLGLLDEPDRSGAAASPVADLKLAPMSPELRSRFRIKDTIKGVVITEVVTDSDAAQKGLIAGTVITEVAQEVVESGADVDRRNNEVKKSGRKTCCCSWPAPMSASTRRQRRADMTRP